MSIIVRSKDTTPKEHVKLGVMQSELGMTY